MGRFLIVVMFSTFSMAVQAVPFYSGDDEKRFTREHELFVENYAKEKGKSVPEVKDYEYGMKLDIAKRVRTSRHTTDTCSPVRRPVRKMMTFENTQGELETVRYSMLPRCPGEN